MVKRLIVVLSVVLIAAVAWYISAYYYQLLMIQGSSMEPSYHPFQIVIIDKHIMEYSRGDVVVFNCDDIPIPTIKRVVACSGDSAVITGNTLLINDIPVSGKDKI